MKKARNFIADLLFLFGHSLVMWSARLMGYNDTAEELKGQKAYWLKTDAFKENKSL